MDRLSLLTQLSAGKPATGDIWELALQSTGAVMGVLLLLIFFSVVSWYIIGYKYIYLSRAKRRSERFLEFFWSSTRLDAIYKEAQKKRSPISQLFKAGYVELSKIKNAEEKSSGGAWLGDMQSIERALDRAQTTELTRLEAMLPFLATTGSAAPFIGLFGTVWGIMDAFRAINQAGAANLGAVSGPISEALIATAIGLMAAIPAVIAYNYFLRRLKVLTAAMDSFTNDFLNIIKRHFFN